MNTRTYATRFSHTARRCSGVISSLPGARSIEGGGGRSSDNDRVGTLAELTGAVEVAALGGIDAMGRAGLLREVPERDFVSFSEERSAELIFGSEGLEAFLGAGSGWGYESREDER